MLFQFRFGMDVVFFSHGGLPCMGKIPLRETELIRSSVDSEGVISTDGKLHVGVLRNRQRSAFAAGFPIPQEFRCKVLPCFQKHRAILRRYRRENQQWHQY